MSDDETLTAKEREGILHRWLRGYWKEGDDPGKALIMLLLDIQQHLANSEDCLWAIRHNTRRPKPKPKRRRKRK